jgi:APA family basic amino acid/polyamine antiporter
VLQLRPRTLRGDTPLEQNRSPATPPAASAPAAPTLRRALGRWDLAAIGINQTIGGAVFLMPSQIAAAVGAWSPFAILGGTLVTMIVAVSLAEVGSRFEATGGPYLYARTAFGRFAAFEVGWMQWFVRVTSHASVANGLALALGYYWAGAAQGTGRAAVIIAITAILTLVNVLGIKQGARTVNLLTIAKLVPLGLFIAIGVFFISPARFTTLPQVGLEQASTAALLTIFVFGGYEVLTVPAGEANDPRRHVPFALIATVIVVGAVTILCQVVAVGTLDNLAASTTPLADAAAGFLGGPGALLIGIGALASMTGNLAGQILTGSRMLYALAEQGDLPRALARIHPGFRTPVNAILFTAGAALVLALSGSFAWLAIASAVARLVTYGVSCGAAVALGRPGRAGRAGAAMFKSPLSPLLPVLGVLIVVALAATASRAQLASGVAALGAGAALFLVSRRRALPAEH